MHWENMASLLANELERNKQCWDVYKKNSRVNTLLVYDWTVQLTISYWFKWWQVWGSVVHSSSASRIVTYTLLVQRLIILSYLTGNYDKRTRQNTAPHYHRSDSMWGTDYIAILFFLDEKVSRTTIKNLSWQLGGEIIQVTFGKSSTSLVQQIKKKFE